MKKKILAALPVLVLVGLCLYFIFTTAPWVRYWVDDFCSAAALQMHGYFGSQVFWWKSWSGRFATTAVVSFFELLGPWSVRTIPFLLLAGLIAGFWRVYKLSKILPILFVFLALINAPNITQSFYWMSGSIVYLAPFIVLNIFLSLILLTPKKINPSIPFLLAFFAGGFDESYALAQLALFAVAYLFFKFTNLPQKGERLKILILGMIGAIAVLALMFFAPGNSVRSQAVTHPASLFFVVKSTIYGTKWYLLRMLSVKPFVYSLFILFTAVFIFFEKLKLDKKSSLVLIACSVLAAVLTSGAVIGVGYYSMAIIPPERNLFIAIYMILVAFFGFSVGTSSLLKKYRFSRSPVFLTILISVYLAVSVLLVRSLVVHWTAVRAEIKNYAVAFDKVEPSLGESRGNERFTMSNINPVGELDSFTDNKGWVASCVAGYYGIDNIKIAP